LKIKICGVTTQADAAVVAEEGADFLGLIFARSPRRVDVKTARDIVRRLPRSIEPVGVFMDQPLDEVKSILAETGLTIAQLHGSENPAFASALGVKVIKAFTAFTEESLARLRLYDTYAFLLDVPKGSNERTRIDLDWAAVAKKHGHVIASGRLTIESVHEVVRKLRPWAVDVCSATEIVPGRKERSKVRAFVQAARTSAADTERIKVRVR
jgi:phosphoribosylanthranilate isomerase